MIGAAIYSLLTSIIHVYPLRAAQGKTLPLATYQVLDNEPTNHIYNRAKVRKVSVQINIVGPVYDTLQSKATSIIAALDRYTGTAGSETIKDIRHTGGPDDMFQDDPELYGVSLYFDFWVKQ